ncbi:hypothetical protein JANAI62_26680 [Jannaschia pagri]|uniref:Uncharacterized protein n=1 Tax=Jannaschia pagri TaxID=2829797 RepID=A0ABQ4NP41_9RHOB|nr:MULTISPECIES: hypothetical protein [unclassified Jannaschia]GIT92210.1 hypothetical protein JANAI61_26680 [Jannaschia sp. AI_61]GIT96045.1 hypothetical protein JANAI62_26680 [Jannaschia sp. AI_62]
MTHKLAILFLDSLAIGIVVATSFLTCLLVFQPETSGVTLNGMGRVTFTLIWMYLSVSAAPFGTLYLLWRMRQS